MCRTFAFTSKPNEITATAADCDALLGVSSKVPGLVIEGLTQCRVIARLGAGVDRIDVATATRCGIVVSNVPDFCLHEQAERDHRYRGGLRCAPGCFVEGARPSD